MVDVVVDILCGNVEICDSINAVEEGYHVPGQVEAAQCCCVPGGTIVVMLPGDAGVRSVGLPGGGQFDEVCDEQVGRNEEVQEQAGDDVGAAVVVTGEAYKDTILVRLAWSKTNG